MPLLDHFHPPLSVARHWDPFHAARAKAIMALEKRSVLPTVPRALGSGPTVPVDLEATYLETKVCSRLD